MANKKKKKAQKQRAAAASAVPENRSLDEDLISKKKARSRSESKKESKESDKGKNKAPVSKSAARAKEPRKSTKKPNIFRRFSEYLKQVRLEIKRTTWPTKNEVLNMTIIVIVALLFFGVLIFVIDLALVELLKLFGQLAPDAAADASLLDAGATDANSGATDTGAATDSSGAASSDADGGE